MLKSFDAIHTKSSIFYSNQTILNSKLFKRKIAFFMEESHNQVQKITKNTLSRSKKNNLLFKDVINMWLSNNQIRYKGATLIKYQNLIDTHILPQLGNIRLSDLNPTTLNLYLSDKMKNGRIKGDGYLSPSYIRTITIIINSVIDFAVKEELRKPFNTPINKPSIIKKELTILSLDEQKRLESFLTTNITPAKIGVLLSLHTGLRIGEVCALTWDDVDLENRIIYVRHTVARVKQDNLSKTTQLIIDVPKTKSSIRDVPINSKLLNILINSKKISKSNYVVSKNEKFISPRTFEYQFHQLLIKSGVKEVNYHTLRHTFATRCIEAGVDIKSLSEILGHANVNTTLNTYVHSSMETKRKEIEKLNNL